VSKEIANLACSEDTVQVLVDNDLIDRIVRHLQSPGVDEMVLYYLGMALEQVAQNSPVCRQQLSLSGLPRVVVPQLLRANLRLRTVYIKLLEHCYGESRRQ